MTKGTLKNKSKQYEELEKVVETLTKQAVEATAGSTALQAQMQQVSEGYQFAVNRINLLEQRITKYEETINMLTGSILEGKQQLQQQQQQQQQPEQIQQKGE